MILDLRKECEGATRIGISGHIRPDGDCVGSVLSVQMYLRKCYPEATVKVFLEQPAPIFYYIKGFDEIDSTFPEQEPFDVYIVVDSIAERTGEAEKYVKAAKKTINIDHHISNTGTCMVNLVRPEVASCCEVLFGLMDEEIMDKDIATAIYTGMIHDTGVFQYSNTTPETMFAAGKLMQYGVDTVRIIQESFYQKTYMQSQIMGRALMESVRFMDGRCIVGVLDQKVLDFYGATSKDLEGIVAQLRNIKGVDCAIFMYQTGVLEYKVSLRTNEKVDASKVCAYFGGGGHMRAAGCTMKGTFHDCVNNLSAQIEKHME